MVASLSDSELVARAARLLCVGFHGHEPSKELQELITLGVRMVILFERNVTHRDHVASLVGQIKALSDEPILVCVDQEGGSTCRLREGFSPPPTMRESFWRCAVAHGEFSHQRAVCFRAGSNAPAMRSADGRPTARGARRQARTRVSGRPASRPSWLRGRQSSGSVRRGLSSRRSGLLSCSRSWRRRRPPFCGARSL